jgi:hypothetical protein
MAQVVNQKNYLLAALALLAILFTVSCSPSRRITNNTSLENSGFSGAPASSGQLTGLIQSTGGEEDSFCVVLQQPLITSMDVLQTPLLSEPAPRASFHDPTFGSCMARLTDRDNDRRPIDTATGFINPGTGAQAFNADNSLILVQSNAGWWYVYSADTLQPVMPLPISEAHAIIWDTTDPRAMYYLKGPHLYAYNLDDSQPRFMRDFANDFPNRSISSVDMKRGSGVTIDGRYWALRVQKTSGNTQAVIIYDLAENQIASQFPLPSGLKVQSTSLSPYGNYVLVQYEPDCSEIQTNGVPGYCGLVMYNRTFEQGRTLLPVSTPFDTGLTADLQEVLVFQDASLGSISMMNLQTYEKHALWLIDTSQSMLELQFSGLATRRPGWVLIATHNGEQVFDSTWMDNSILAIELAPNGRAVRLAHTHNTLLQNGTPEAETTLNPRLLRASPNQDFTRVLFTSNWGQASPTSTDVYLIALPLDWTSNLP